MKRLQSKYYEGKGITALLAQKISDKFLKDMLETNPGILTMFRDRDVRPYRNHLEWSGEFAGKYLTSAYFIYRQTGDKALKEYAVQFIGELLALQGEDGYMGCFPKETRFTEYFAHDPKHRPATWDAWGHYHIMYALLLWWEETGDSAYFSAVKKAADLIEKSFYGDRPTILSTGWPEMNFAVYHVFAKLYLLTGEEKYFAFLKRAEEDMRGEGSGDWLEYGATGKRYCDSPKPRWESLHAIMGFADMFQATGEEKYLTALRTTVESIIETDVHNTGGFSTKEQAVGTPYRNETIETCCVVAFDALVLELYRITEDVSLIETLERAHYNAVLGAVSPSGAWCTYDTPMDGEKVASYLFNGFQIRAGTPFLNCCSANYGRGVGQISEWAFTENKRGVYVNNYENGRVVWQGGEIEICGGYPYVGRTKISCRAAGETRGIFLRIPKWSENTVLTVNGKKQSVCSGAYFEIPKESEVEIAFDYTPKFERGGEVYADQYSVYTGPILWAYDLTNNAAFAKDNGCTGGKIEERLADMRLPIIPLSDFKKAEILLKEGGMVEMKLDCGVKLTDFWHAGMTGGVYKTWLKIDVRT